MRELAQTISRLDFGWVKTSFLSALTGALEALSLQPI
jgi:hypothetical protein